MANNRPCRNDNTPGRPLTGCDTRVDLVSGPKNRSTLGATNVPAVLRLDCGERRPEVDVADHVGVEHVHQRVDIAGRARGDELLRDPSACSAGVDIKARRDRSRPRCAAGRGWRAGGTRPVTGRRSTRTDSNGEWKTSCSTNTARRPAQLLEHDEQRHADALVERDAAAGSGSTTASRSVVGLGPLAAVAAETELIEAQPADHDDEQARTSSMASRSRRRCARTPSWHHVLASWMLPRHPEREVPPGRTGAASRVP